MKTHRWIGILLAGVLCVPLASCDEGIPSAPASSLGSPSFGGGTIRGTIRFVGTPPERRMIDLGESCLGGPSFYQEETVVVSGGGGLRDVIVHLKDAPASSGRDQPRVTVDQTGCAYTPHVVAVQQGQGLRIASNDGVFHNVRWNAGVNPGGNLNFKVGDAAQVQFFERPDFIRLQCDVHPWMQGYVGVLASPFFGVSDSEGRFTIDRVPPGTYTLATWHPMLGERQQSVTVTADGTVEANLKYARPGT